MMICPEIGVWVEQEVDNRTWSFKLPVQPFVTKVVVYYVKDARGPHSLGLKPVCDENSGSNTIKARGMEVNVAFSHALIFQREARAFEYRDSLPQSVSSVQLYCQVYIVKSVLSKW